MSERTAKESDAHNRIRAGYDKTVADSWRAHCAKIEAERDRLARILAVERGDESQAPEGWRMSIDRAWLYDRPRIRGQWQRPHQIIWRDGYQPIADDHAPAGDYEWTCAGTATGRAPTALEAMEAAEACMSND